MYSVVGIVEICGEYVLATRKVTFAKAMELRGIGFLLEGTDDDIACVLHELLDE